MFYERFPYKEEVTGSNPVAPTKIFQKTRKKYCSYEHNTHIFFKNIFFNYYEYMKYKKDLGALLVFLGIVWNVFSSIRSSYTPTQVILVAILAYLGIRLTYFVYFKNN